MLDQIDYTKQKVRNWTFNDRHHDDITGILKQG
jgi:hypothetical protein